MENEVEITLGRIEGFIEGFWWILPNLGIALVVFVLFLFAAWGAKAVVSRVFRRRRRPDLAALLSSFTKWVVVALGLLVVAAIVFPSVQPADILATLGIGSVAVGFAFKDILQNWLAGLLILLRQPFRRGDQIAVGDFTGTVEQIEARATLIRTFDERRVVIPNSDIYTRAVILDTAFEKRRSEYDVGIGYGDDIGRARQAILSALETVAGVEKEPAPEVNAWELTGSTVTLKVWWWSRPERRELVHVRGRVIESIKRALGEAGIDIPFPTRVVLFHDQTEETDGDRRRQREGWPAGPQPPRPRHLNEVRLQQSDLDGGQGGSPGEHAPTRPRRGEVRESRRPAGRDRREPS